MKYDVSLILACYNEHEIFYNSVSRIIKTLDATDYTYEIIFVDDCSQDNTRQLIDKTLLKYPKHNLSAIYHSQNLGRGQTVIDGFNQSQGKIIGYIDIDLETGEWYLPKFFGMVDQGYDVASAMRIYDFQFWSLPRWLGSKVYSWLRKKLLGLPFEDTEGGYKFFKRQKLLPLLNQTRHKGWFFDTEIMALAYQAKLKIVEIPVAFVRNPHKTSTVRLLPDSIKYLFNLIKFSFSYDHH